MGEKDATELKSGTATVIDLRDSREERPEAAAETPGTSEVSTDAGAASTDRVAGAAAPGDVVAADLRTADMVAEAGATADATTGTVVAENAQAADESSDEGAIAPAASTVVTDAAGPESAGPDGSPASHVAPVGTTDPTGEEAIIGAGAAAVDGLSDTAAVQHATANVPADGADGPAAEAATESSPSPAATGAAEDTAAQDPAPADGIAEWAPGGDTGENGAALSGALADEAATPDVAAEASATNEPASDYEPPVRASAELKAILEALIFASPEPLSLKALTKLLDSEPKEDVATALVGLKEDYERPGGLQLVEVAGGYQIVTRHDLHEWVRRLFHERSTQKLSAQALETLAVIAYRQPITAAEITEIRGVNTSGVLNTLLERHLIKIVGRKAVVGRPFMYSTTKEFLIRFGLNDLTDLPRVEDMVDALGLEAPLLVEQAPLEDQLPLEEPDAESTDGPLEDGEELTGAEASADAAITDKPGGQSGGSEGSVH